MMFRINVLMILVLTMLATSCKTPENAPVEMVTVPVPVAVGCLQDPPPRPSWQLDKPDMQSHAVLLKQALHDALVARGYADELEAALSACH